MTRAAQLRGFLLVVCLSHIIAWPWPFAAQASDRPARGQALKFTASSTEWQHAAVQKVFSLKNTTEGLQQLVTAAQEEQIAKGVERPAVVITIANDEGVSHLLPMFLDTLGEAAPILAATTIVIAVSQPAFEECQKRQILCFFDREADEKNKELARAPKSGLPRNKTPQFLQIGWDKLRRLQEALDTGATILFADTDIAWLQNPLPHLTRSGADLQLTHDGWGPNIGVMFVKPTHCIRVFMSEWLARRDKPEARDQYEFDAAVESATKKCPHFKVEYLKKTSFPNGCCCGKELPKTQKEAQQWMLWHAACSGDLAEKKRLLDAIVQANHALKFVRVESGGNARKHSSA